MPYRYEGASPFAKPTAFARELRKRVWAYEAQYDRGRYADATQWFTVAITTGIWMAAYGALLSAGTSQHPLISLALAAAIGFASFMLLALIGDDAAHGSASSRP